MNVKFDEVYNSPDNFIHVQKSGDENISYKKAFTYDDILSSMNLVISPDGVLQYMNTKTTDPDSRFSPKKATRNNIDPQLKHSYIYNKYYKNYKDSTAEAEHAIRRPMTKEEYKQFIINEIINIRKNKQRIAQIKPKKMAFTTTPNTIIHKPIYYNSGKSNHLFKIRFQQ
jgi:hypothetical protein